MKNYPYILILALFAMVSCQKVVDAERLLDADEEVFIRGYLSPQDTVLRVHVSRVLPSIGTTFSVQDQEANIAKFLITDAQVTISDASGNSTDLAYNSDAQDYLVDASTLDILEDERYFLKVIVEGKEYNASCTIPKKIETIEENIALVTNEFGSQIARLQFSFQDILGEDNFYAFGAIARGTFQFDGEQPQNFEFVLFFDSDTFQTDGLVDGGTISSSPQEFFLGDGSVEQIDTLVLQVGHLEEVLFQNLRSSSTNADADGNPFVEYSIAPNNILDNGAVGVFAGYNVTEKTIVLDF